MNRFFMRLAVSAAVLSLAACSPSNYEEDKADLEAEEQPQFSFSVERCEGQTTGRFSLTDPDWDIPVDIAGDVVNFVDAGQSERECRFYAHLEYESLNPDYPGKGRAVACFAGMDPCSQIWVTIESGPYEKYRNEEAIPGGLEPCGCSEAQ